MILFQQGKIETAKKFFAKAVQIDPGYKDAINNLLILKSILHQDEK